MLSWWLSKGSRRDPVHWSHRQRDQHHIQVLSAEAAATIAKSEHNADQAQLSESDELRRQHSRRQQTLVARWYHTPCLAQLLPLGRERCNL